MSFEQLDASLYFLQLKWKHFITTYIYLLQLAPTTWVLIDTGPPEEEAAVISAFSEAFDTFLHRTPLRAIILTHGHIDHVGGLMALCQSEYMDSRTRVYLHEEEQFFVLEKGSKRLAATASNVFFRGTMALRLFQDVPDTTRREVARLLENRIRTVTNGDCLLDELAIFHTPGHTPGHICILQREKQRLFVGDCIMYVGCCCPYLSGSFPMSTPNRNLATESLKNMLLQIRTDSATEQLVVLPSHHDAPVGSLTFQKVCSKFL